MHRSEKDIEVSEKRIEENQRTRHNLVASNE